MRAWAGVLIGLAALLTPPSARAETPASPPAAAGAYETIAYEVALTPPGDTDLAERIRGDLDLLKKKAEGAPSIGVLESRLERDLARVRQALKAYGYYDGVASRTYAEGSPAG